MLIYLYLLFYSHLPILYTYYIPNFIYTILFPIPIHFLKLFTLLILFPSIFYIIYIFYLTIIFLIMECLNCLDFILFIFDYNVDLIPVVLITISLNL